MLWLVKEKVRLQLNQRKLDQEKDIKMSVMLYKCPGKHLLHEIKCDYIVVDESEVESNLSKGWSKSPTEAKVALDNKKTKPKKETKKEAPKKEAQTLDILDEEAEDVVD